MKIIVSAALAISLLAMGSTLASAQTGNNNPAFATKQDLQPLQSEQNQQGQQLKNLNGAVNTANQKLTALAAKQSGDIDAVRFQESVDNAIVAAKQDAFRKVMNESAADTKTRTSNLWYGLMAISAIVVLAVIAGIYFWRRNQKTILGIEEKISQHMQAEEKFQAKSPIRIELRVFCYVDEPRFTNEEVRKDLKRIWEDMRMGNPTGPMSIPMSIELNANPDNGLAHRGRVDKFIVVFDDNDMNGFPDVFYEGKKILFRHRRGHAEKILKAMATRTMAAPLSFAPQLELVASSNPDNDLIMPGHQLFPRKESVAR